MITIGDRIRAKKMSDDSFYLQAEGLVTGIRNGFVEFEADYVMDKWSKQWKKHPTSCATATRLENAVKIFTPEQSVKFQIELADAGKRAKFVEMASTMIVEIAKERELSDAGMEMIFSECLQNVFVESK